MSDKMKVGKTGRGLGVAEFTDANGVSCSIQVSSACRDEYLVWLGCNEIGLKRFEPGKGWSDVPLQEEGVNGVNHLANTRMHLTQTMVRNLLPLLRNFANTGRLAHPKRKRKQKGSVNP